MFSVRRVDGSQETQAALLRWLQLETLGGDEPLATTTGWWWIAYHSGQPVGFCGLRRSAQWFDTAYLCRAGVLKQFRGKGLQKRLIRVRERHAKRLKMNWLITDTYNNPQSANSIISCGFKMFTPSKPWGADETCYWRKKL
jgi:GNAT superfamily N-acetyltransferase